MTTEEAIQELHKLLGQIPAVGRAGRDSALATRWRQNVSFELPRIFGPKAGIFRNFQLLTWSPPGGTPIPGATPWNLTDALRKLTHSHFLIDLERAQGILESAIDQLERVGLEAIRRESGYIVREGAEKIFISHGHAEDVLRRVEDFVRALGFEPVVVKRLASEGAAIDDLVERRMEECTAAIILATADDEIDGRKQPRLNVIHEIGLAQGILANRVIYLKEMGCEFPSNISPKVWEDFERLNVGSAFEKIVKELRAFGLLN